MYIIVLVQRVWRVLVVVVKKLSRAGFGKVNQKIGFRIRFGSDREKLKNRIGFGSLAGNSIGVVTILITHTYNKNIDPGPECFSRCTCITQMNYALAVGACRPQWPPHSTLFGYILTSEMVHLSCAFG